MSRRMLLACALVVIIVTVQFEWKQVRDEIHATTRESWMPLQTARREDDVKEKVILSQEKIIHRLNELVRSLKKQLLRCQARNVTVNSTMSAFTENLIGLEP